ncbi:acetyl-CoA synthetase-like protein [Lanmaoa asiatica]|nr:acetyl-CoA synthetase-like protein [Lanmaoa asiatica]
MPAFAPLDGSLLFADLVNFHIENNGSHSLYVYANDTPSGGTTDITFLEFGRAAHRVAHALRPARHGKEGQVVMLIATIDTLLYHALVAGMLVSGLVPFLVSPRNSPAAIVNMIQKTRCSRIVTVHSTHQTLMDAIRREASNLELTIDEIPALSYAFPNLGRECTSNPFVPYPSPTLRPDLDSPAIYLHSSGSTGFPKPISFSHRIQIKWMSHQPTLGYRGMPRPVRMGVMSLPAFHIYGLMMQLYVPFACVVTAALFPPRSITDVNVHPVMPTTDNILEHTCMTKCSILMCIPVFLEQWVASPDVINLLKTFDLVVCFPLSSSAAECDVQHLQASGGGPLPLKVGNTLSAAGVPIATGFGATECGIITSIPSREDIADGDWHWLRIADGIDVRWIPEGDDIYECHVLGTDGYPVTVENLADVRGYATGDLFVKHPTKDKWKIVGRRDDVIVLASGEKTVPTPMEGIINSSPMVQGVVMFGRQRNQVGILVEPRPEYCLNTQNDQLVQEFRDKVWPWVEEANRTAPAFSRIFKEMILITHGDKPMQRTAKGSIQKRVVIKDYESEIDTLYQTIEHTSRSLVHIPTPLACNGRSLSRWLMEHACAVSSGRDIDPDADFLSVTYLRNQLVNALGDSPKPRVRSAATRIPTNIVFENPTINSLSARVSALISQDDILQIPDHIQQRKAAIEAMIHKYSMDLLGNPDGIIADNGVIDHKMQSAGTVVLLTGTTGGLGSFLLAQLLENPVVEKVYALNRPSASVSIAERQRSAFVDKALPFNLLSSGKLVYIEADVSQDSCGLTSSIYNELRNSVTVIIHNAWRLDFNLSLSSFEPQVRATRNLVDLALASTHRESLRFVFTSSIGSAHSWDRSRGLYPEEVLLDSSFAVGAGYGESKYVSERIIVKSGLHATSLRIGQIAGGFNGSWATTDWFPILVKSSIALGALPDARGLVSWMRADEVATAILEIASAKTASPPALNIVNPRGVPWTDILTSVREEIIEQRDLKVVDIPMIPFGEWFSLLEKQAEGACSEDISKMPAIKLLEYFRVMAQGDSDQSTRKTSSIFDGD